MTTPTTAPYKQLRRPLDDRIVAGVCSGVGRYFGIDPVLVRVAFAVLAVITWGTALLAYPTTWRKTLVGFAIGFPLIYALNVARILMLLVVGHYYPQAFNFMHVYFWQVTMIVMVVTVMYVWVRWVVREEAAQAA